MELLLLSPRGPSSRRGSAFVDTVIISNSQFQVNQVVEYYSASHRKWYETTVVTIHPDSKLDLKCRENVDPSVVRAKPSVPALKPTPVTQHVPNQRKAVMESKPMLEPGAKCEYFSDTMNGWVLSYVRGVNPDGTYALNTKKSADPSRVRPLLSPQISVVTPVQSVRPPVTTHPQSIYPQPSSHSSRLPPATSTPSSPFITSVKLKSPSPALDMYKSELFEILRIPSSSSLTRLSGFTGGQNQGIWFAKSNERKTHCLKVVKSARRFPSMPSERENYVELLERFPKLISDHSITFPVKVVQLVDKQAGGNKPVFDVIVMPVAKGGRMAEVIGNLDKDTGGMALITKIFTAVGAQLKKFHSDYADTQHTDLQTSNIFIDIQAPSQPVGVSFIDLGGMGTMVQSGDVDYFKESIRLLANTYGSEFGRIATAAFLNGYGGS